MYIMYHSIPDSGENVCCSQSFEFGLELVGSMVQRANIVERTPWWNSTKDAAANQDGQSSSRHGGGVIFPWKHGYDWKYIFMFIPPKYGTSNCNYKLGMTGDMAVLMGKMMMIRLWWLGTNYTMYCTLFVEHLNEFDDIATRQTPGIAVFVVCLFQKQPFGKFRFSRR